MRLGRKASKSMICEVGDIDPSVTDVINRRGAGYDGQDPRLKPMPGQPSAIDFFRLRFPPGRRRLQSAALALEAGCVERIVLACLLHDISVIAFIAPDHGCWCAH